MLPSCLILVASLVQLDCEGIRNGSEHFGCCKLFWGFW